MAEELEQKSPASVQMHMKSLEAHGYLQILPRGRRNIRITPRGYIALSAVD